MSRCLLFSVLVAGTVLGYCSRATADTVVVSLSNSFEDKSVEVSAGGAVNVSIHLMSIAEPVEGFIVFLVDATDSNSAQSAISDKYGIAKFSGVPRGKYVAILSKPREGATRSTVKLADITFSTHETSSGKVSEEKSAP